MEDPHAHPRHGRLENILRTDFAILSFLRDSILSGHLGFVSLQDAYESGLFSLTDCDWGCFRRRVFCQIGLGYADFDPLFLKDDGSKIVSVDYIWSDASIPPTRLSPAGFLHIEELGSALKKYEGWNRYITPWREMFRDAKKYRWVLAILLAGALMLTTFIFGMPMSNFLKNIPLASSVIDAGIFSKLGTTRGQDGLHQTIISATSRGQESVSRMEVVSISESERIFRIILDDGYVCEIRIRKEGDSYRMAALRDGCIKY